MGGARQAGAGVRLVSGRALLTWEPHSQWVALDETPPGPARLTPEGSASSPQVQVLVAGCEERLLTVPRPRIPSLALHVGSRVGQHCSATRAFSFPGPGHTAGMALAAT